MKHSQIHNIYGQKYHEVTHNALKQRYNGELRPFILSRSFYAGTQKYGFIWTGDNTSSEKQLHYSIDMLLSLHMCGIVLSGADVGGFFGNPTEELLCEWYEVITLC